MHIKKNAFKQDTSALYPLTGSSFAYKPQKKLSKRKKNDLQRLVFYGSLKVQKQKITNIGEQNERTERKSINEGIMIGIPLLFRLSTGGGYPFDEVASSLQKTIRRGLEEEAMYWAIELETKFPDYLWKRLQIISIEDIGIADAQVVLYVAEMRKLYQELKKDYDKDPDKKSRSFRMVLANAILAMCRAKKSRIGDEFQIAIYGRREAGWKLDVPDYALDMHTSRGRGMKRGQEHFWTEGVKLGNEYRLKNPYSEEAVKIRTRHQAAKGGVAYN